MMEGLNNIPQEKEEKDELLDKYLSKMEEKIRKRISDNKSVKEYTTAARNLAIRGFMSGNIADVEEMVANSLAAVYLIRKANSI